MWDRELQRLEQVAAHNRAKQTDNDVANNTVTATPHDHAGQPSHDATDDQHDK